MSRIRTFRYLAAHIKISRVRVMVCLAALAAARGQTPPPSSPVVLDSVVAVVNNQVILSSDLDEEMRISILEPDSVRNGPETPERALQRLISRSLIRQQIREEDAQATVPTAKEIADRLDNIRKELPACVRENCATDAGWKAFLTNHDLTQDQVDSYLLNRLEILNFIEVRFRQGISISHQEIETYYQDMLLPQYPQGEKAPALEQVSPRIEEILLQQKVNVLFRGWLENLRNQGEVEVLDPKLEAAATPEQGTRAQ